MGFIIRSAFWLSLVLLLIPFGGTHADGTPAVSPFQAFFAAREAVSDIAAMCERKPEVCEVGRSAVQTITVRARESAKLAMHYLDDGASEPEVVTGSIPQVATAPETEQHSTSVAN